jgi:hypothetical protein
MNYNEPVPIQINSAWNLTTHDRKVLKKIAYESGLQEASKLVLEYWFSQLKDDEELIGQISGFIMTEISKLEEGK